MSKLPRGICVVVAGLLLAGLVRPGQAPPVTGPATEKRFPPLTVPAGFKATLFACDPLIEYPSVIALGPRPGSIFVAIDYMTGLGVEIVRRDEIRLAEDTDGDGYADRAPVYADGFNSIQGLEYHAGAVYVMHAPLLTVLRDTDGDGKADQRRDLVSGLGLPPEKNPPRLHCANGVVMGHDGWLYLALGDHGCDVQRPEGDRLVFEGGGILRCRPDGRDLHVFSTGLRNIYDVALDDELNVFVRDNENDGGDYMIRVCHSFFGADHGYPYLYYERPDEALAPMADLGRGSSAGGVCYLEQQFPPEYRGNLFFCEWGRSVVRSRRVPAGSGFARTSEDVFAFAADNDPYGFHPTGIVVERDGSMMVSDWCDGQRPKRGRGRLYRIRSSPLSPLGRGVGGEGQPARQEADNMASRLARLGAESHHERAEAQQWFEKQGRAGIDALLEANLQKELNVRARRHAVWIIARAKTPSTERLFDLAEHDPEASVRAQAVRALADLADPVLVAHRLDAGPGDGALAGRIARLGSDADARVRLEVVVALARLRWLDFPAWLPRTLSKADATLGHAVQQALRRSGNWGATLKLLDAGDGDPWRPIALRALADQVAPEIADGLIARLGKEESAGRRRGYADLLTRVYKKPGAWKYWGYRPAPRPANTVAWERTEAIAAALDRVLADPDQGVRLAVLPRMRREGVPTRLETLARWLGEETSAAGLAALLTALADHPAAATGPLLEQLAAQRTRPESVRRQAFDLLASQMTPVRESRLLMLAQSLEDGPVLAAALGEVGRRAHLKAAAFFVSKSASPDARVRAAALEALAAPGRARASIPVESLLQRLGDDDAAVRQAAARAAGRLEIQAAAATLLERTRDADPAVREACFDALRRLRERRVLPHAAAALNDAAAPQAALECLTELGGPEHAAAVEEGARRHPAGAPLVGAIAALSRWADNTGKPDLHAAVARLQGVGGVLARWSILNKAPADFGLTEPQPPGAAIIGKGVEARVRLKPAGDPRPPEVWALASFEAAEPMNVQFLAGSTVALEVYLNGKSIYRRVEAKPFQPDADRFQAALVKGTNRMLVKLEAGQPEGGKAAEFHVRFRRVSSRAEHESLTQAALGKPGNAERGRKIFFDAQRAQCIKCHRLGTDGERIGPELTGVGSRFARVYLIESILEPGRTIAPSYQTTVVALKDGRALQGIKIAEDGATMTLADQKGDKHTLKKADIDLQRPSPQSTMPEGLERQLTSEEFVDLIAFLVSEKAR